MKIFVCLLTVALISAASVGAPIVVKHVVGQDGGWRGFWNPDTKGRPSNWGGAPECNADLGAFDRVAIQAAINTAIAAEGDWDAYLVVTHPDWGTGAMGSLVPVAGVYDVDTTIVWGAMATHTDGDSSWTDGAVTGQFEPVMLTGGSSVVEGSPSYTFRPNAIVPAQEDVVIDISEGLVQHFLDTASAGGFFVSGTQETEYQVYGGNQWGGSGDIRLEILPVPEPATMGLLALGGLGVLIRRKK